jgi:hypothetical protein
MIMFERGVISSKIANSLRCFGAAPERRSHNPRRAGMLDLAGVEAFAAGQVLAGQVADALNCSGVG